jgi:hypothetical protein
VTRLSPYRQRLLPGMLLADLAPSGVRMMRDHQVCQGRCHRSTVHAEAHQPVEQDGHSEANDVQCPQPTKGNEPEYSDGMH